MKTISVLIPDGENEHVLWVVRSLAQVGGVKMHVLSNTRWMPVRFSRHCVYEHRPIGADPEARLEALAEIARRKHVDVILPCSELGVLFAVTHRERLAKLAALPPLPSLDCFNLARNKWQLNQFALQRGLPVPDAVLATLDAEFDRRLDGLEYPALLKPVAMTDGQGIRRFENPSQLRQFLANQDAQVFKDKFIVQPFVPGSDMGLSVLCRDGKILALTIQRGIISASHRFGPLMAMEFIQKDDVLAMGHRLMSALNWGGVAHVDLRLDSRDGQAKILEINARYWGSLLGSLVAGVNFAYLACQAALGIPFDPPSYQLSKYAHTTTAIKEGVLSLVGRSSLKGFTFQETGLRFCCVDPLPEIVKRVQETVQ